MQCLSISLPNVTMFSQKIKVMTGQFWSDICYFFYRYFDSFKYSAILNIDKPELEPMGPSRGGTGHNFWTWAAPFMYYQAAGTAPAPGFCIAGSILNIALWARALVCSSRSSMT